MRLLRRVAVIAASVTMLAAMGVGLAESAPAAPDNTSENTLCVFVSETGPQFVCIYDSPINTEVIMALDSGYVYVSTNDGTYGQIKLGNSNPAVCLQGWANSPYNGGWAVRLELCANHTGQMWRAVTGPTVHGFRTYYWVNEYNPAYCLAWDEAAGTLFANTCRNAWYQQFGLNVN